MKILHVLPKYKIGGVESTIFNSFNSINLVYDYNLLAIEKNNERFISDSNIAKEKIRTLNGKFWSLFTLLKFIFYINNNKPDIIIISLWKSALLCLICYPLIKFRKIKVIHFIHSAYFANFLDKFITPKLAKIADNIYCDSYSSKEFIESKTKKKATIISFLVNKRSSITVNNKDFVYIARLNSTKNILGALDIFELIHNKFPKCKFDIYGPDEGELKKLNQNIKYKNLQKVVTYHGPLDNSKVEKTLAKYAFYLQPSHKEGMAISVIDAMQIGVIPCVFAVGEIRYYSTHLKNIIHLDKNDINISANIILNVMSNNILHQDLKKNAIISFKNTPTYSESLLMHLKELSTI